LKQPQDRLVLLQRLLKFRKAGRINVGCDLQPIPNLQNADIRLLTSAGHLGHTRSRSGGGNNILKFGCPGRLWRINDGQIAHWNPRIAAVDPNMARIIRNPINPTRRLELLLPIRSPLDVIPYFDRDFDYTLVFLYFGNLTGG
jgi:hypothetical protein